MPATMALPTHDKLCTPASHELPAREILHDYLRHEPKKKKTVKPTSKQQNEACLMAPFYNVDLL